MDKAQLETTAQAEKYKLSFDFERKKASFEMTANSVINPFKRDTLEYFRCIEKL